MRLGRNDVWINVQYGSCLADLEKYEEAIEKFEYALSLDEETEETEIRICLMGNLVGIIVTQGTLKKLLNTLCYLKKKEEMMFG